MASVTSKLSLATRFALRQFRHRLRLRHRLAGDTIFTIWTRPLFACANNGAAGSPLDPRFLRRGLANLPACEDSTGRYTRLPLGAEREPEDLEDDYDDPYYPGNQPILDLASHACTHFFFQGYQALNEIGYNFVTY
jgi:hypothetical protein